MGSGSLSRGMSRDLEGVRINVPVKEQTSVVTREEGAWMAAAHGVSNEMGLECH